MGAHFVCRHGWQAAEVDERRHAIARQLKAAHLPRLKTLEEFDSTQPALHDLRREAGSLFLEGGMSDVQRVLDHSRLGTTSRYLNVNRDGMHSALERFEKTRTIEERKAARGKRPR